MMLSQLRHIRRLGNVCIRRANHIPLYRREYRTGSPLNYAEVAMAAQLDITGNALSANKLQGDGMVLLDEAIMNLITFEADPLPQLHACVKIDRTCGLVNCLLVFELLRNPPINMSDSAGSSSNRSESQYAIPRLLSSLEERFDSLSQREQYLASAALAWSQGHYSRCSALLESAILLSPGDTLALRLAQDSYLAAGDSRNSLACVTRCLQVRVHVGGLYCTAGPADCLRVRCKICPVHAKRVLLS